MKSLEEKKLLVKMMRLFGQSVDQELVESIKREEELAKVFFGEVKQPEIDVVANAPLPPIVEIINTPVPILKTDSSPRFVNASNIDAMQSYELDSKPEIIEKVAEPKVDVPQSILKELEILSKKFDILQKRFNNNIGSGGGGGVVRMSDLDNLIAKHDIIPDLDEVFNLGAPDRRFKDLYLSGNTITLGNTTLGADAGGGLVIGDTIVGSNVAPVTVTASALKSAAGPIDENEAEVAASYTVSTNKYAKSVGPIKLNKSVVFTIPKTSKWKILA